MSFQGTAYHADSDADDEYERSVMTSPHLPTDSETSPTDSEPPSAEQTPTTYGAPEKDHHLPKTIITEWTAEESADFVAGLGLRQYCDTFIENEIVGEALIALKHDELKEMGINSVGHRLTILKSVYEMKIKQDIPLDPDHYIPLSADQSLNENATQEDIARIIQSIQLRDERIVAAEAELRRLTEDYRRLREELLPVFKMAKDRSQPLPYQPSPELYDHENQPITTPTITHPPEQQKSSSGISRSFSKRIFTGGSGSKNNSPTHIPPSVNDGSVLNPSAAAVAASTHLSAGMNGQPSPKSVNMPSPTSPSHYPQTLASRSYAPEGVSNSNRTHDHSEDTSAGQSRPDRNTSTPGSQSRQGQSTSSSRAESRGGDGAPPSVEIFKSFRVSMDDPCHKVLPAALKKYNINADWRQYALYIVYGDQERCLGLDEKPLILFKQLDKEGRKPMFMLRKHTQPAEGHTSSIYSATGSAPNSAGYDSSGRPQIQLPGGVL
ncbi:hypothetical protein DTO166G4_7985 [Paecilomyces variotii]|nr:hypothetical protein DTO032I3_7611 [Paecilomyces variotii]KAJ9210428.1 hypothetical protein DTO166G4_7985 [Paecilomyces variotii]KAJ9219454.1 hypothetical protein DTO169C6_8184 [Paecilomyces variotii]KAJ9229774.1 hypothetical protein DTO166G5_7696 [Paecilomyces variotii]KAJ9244812.1 hypothetical protein DTO169E5_1193 [Paecilomyces variotii]